MDDLVFRLAIVAVIAIPLFALKAFVDYKNYGTFATGTIGVVISVVIVIIAFAYTPSNVNDVAYSEHTVSKEIKRVVGSGDFINIKPMDKGVAESGVVISLKYENIFSGKKGVSSNLHTMKDVFKEVSKIEGIDSIMIDSYTELSNKYGETMNTAVLSLRIDKGTFDRVEWDNFKVESFKDVAEFYFEHPALTK